MKNRYTFVLTTTLVCCTPIFANATELQTCGRATFVAFVEAGRLAEFTRAAIEAKCAKIAVAQRPPVCETIRQVSNAEINKMFLSIVENEIPCDIAREATADWRSKVGAEIAATQLREVKEDSYTYLTPAQIAALDSQNKSRAGQFLRKHFGAIGAQVTNQIAGMQRGGAQHPSGKIPLGDK